MTKVYSEGVFHCSVCLGDDQETMLREANRQFPAGTTNGWTLSDESFASGTPNPCPCTDKPDTHKHYLLSC